MNIIKMQFLHERALFERFELCCDASFPWTRILSQYLYHTKNKREMENKQCCVALKHYRK